MRTNFGDLAVALHPEFSRLLTDYKDYLTSTYSKENLNKFIKVHSRLPEGEVVDSDILRNRLREEKFEDSDVEFIVKEYELGVKDPLHRESVFNNFTESIYRQLFIDCDKNYSAFYKKLNSGNFRVPTYNGVIDDKHFKCIGLEDVTSNMDEDYENGKLRSFLPFINNSIIGKSGYLPNSLICVSASPNVGKSLFMINETINALKQGKRVLYAAFGDMDGMDFKSRMTNVILKMDKNKVFIDLDHYYDVAKATVPEIADINKFKIEIISPAYFDVDEWIELNDRIGTFDNYDVIFVDYDGNIKNSSLYGDSSYDQEGYKYDKLKSIAMTGKIVFVGSQMKIANWNDLIIGQNAVSDSSKKQRVIDLLLTISKDNGGNVPKSTNRLGYINIAKNRRGALQAQRYFLDVTGEFKEISEEMYQDILMNPNPVTLEVNMENSEFEYKNESIKEEPKAESETKEESIL